MIKLRLTKDSLSVKKMKKARGRSREATQRVLLHMADFLQREIKGSAPKLGEYDYAKDLEVATVTGAKEPAVALVVDQKSRKLQTHELDRTVVAILPKQGASKLIVALAQYSPWPAHLLPVQISQTEATMVAIRGSRRDIDYLTKRFIADRSQIERQIKAAGVQGFKIDRSQAAAGSDVNDDLSLTILRYEFGIGERGHEIVHGHDFGGPILVGHGQRGGERVFI